MKKISISPALILIMLTSCSFISLDNANSPLIISEVVSGPINPSAGQFANGIIQNLAPDMSLLDEGWLNFTYIGYLSENIFNISQRLSTNVGTNDYWLLINVTDRNVIEGTSWWVGSYDPWIPTNIEMGVSVTIGLSHLTVQAKEIITVKGIAYDTSRLYGELSDSNTTAWYDVNSGHWVKSIQEGPNSVSQWFLESSNIVVPYEESIPPETTTTTMSKSTTTETTTLPETISTSITTSVETTSSVVETLTTSPQTPTTTIEPTSTQTKIITTSTQVSTSPGETTHTQPKTTTPSVITTVMPEMSNAWTMLLFTIGTFGIFRGRLKRRKHRIPKKV